ncbi:aldehyde dehydrogenase [hydrothermal vent metagenome]|uniref:Aldehyde dehydrogenase n=1 Tax=hydrothermal vent metagenome TaxID=652676 RepID=A0A1W1EL59_9ZZZZ
MFGFFKSKVSTENVVIEKDDEVLLIDEPKSNTLNRADIFFGSTQEDREERENILNPYNKEIVSSVPICNKEDTLKALDIAKKAFIETKKSPLSQRVAWLEDVVKYMEDNLEEFAMTLTQEVAKPIAFSRVEVQRAIETIKITIYELANINGETIPTDITPTGKKTIAFYKREAVGVVACITPFNFPLNLVVHKIAPALGMGNSVVLKPTPEAPMIAFLLAKAFINSRYAIKDALSVVYGDADVGSTLVSSNIPRVISFTGSVPVGKIIMAQAGIKKVSLELGGNAGTYIQSSADISLASKRCAYGAFINSGQVCISLQRIYVDSDIYDEFSQALADETKKLISGNPFEDDTFIGPLINDESNQRATEWIQQAIEEGAEAISGAKIEDGVFLPTVMKNVTDDMNIVCQEVFAPIVSLIKVDSYEEAMSKINSTEYGLQFSIFTNDLKLTERFIEDSQSGGVVINDIPTLRFDVQPYGGTKLSGIGREGPKWALEEFSEIKSVVIC